MKHRITCLFFIFVFCCVLLVGCGSKTEQILEKTNVVEEFLEPPSMFCDERNGISFMLPAGWSVSPVDHTNESMRITVGSGGAPFMKYTCRDFYKELFEDGKTGISRADLNNDLFLTVAADEAFGYDMDSAEQVQFGDNVFFRMEYATNNNPGVAWFRMENGWFDIFEFEADAENPFYGQYEELVSSVAYNRLIPEDEMKIFVEEESSGVLLSGEWSEEKFSRNGRSSPYFIFDYPLEKCKGFTLIYKVSDVTDGKMKSDSKFQIYYGLSDDSWVKGKEFTLDDDGTASIDQKIDNEVTVTKIAVHCLNAGYFNFTYIFGVVDPIY